MLLGGIWSAAVNLGVFAWMLHRGFPLGKAMSLTFVSLVLIEFLKAYNFRSDQDSVFRRPFANRWLNIAILWEVFLLFLVMTLPLLRSVFGTHSLAPGDWLMSVAVAVTVVPVLETGKWLIRRRARGPGNEERW